MRTLLSLLVILAASATPPDVAGVNRVLDDWHKAAAGADETRYFGYAAPEFVFLGTDASERWELAVYGDRLYASRNEEEDRATAIGKSIVSARSVVYVPK